MPSGDIADSKVTFMQDLFTPSATRYDRLLTLLTLGQIRYWRREGVKATRVASGGRVLDIATGTGRSATALLDVVAPNGTVVGVDVTPTMMKAGLAGSDSTSRIHFVVARAEKLPFREGAFDASTISLALRNVSDVRGTIREMTRVVRDGGVVVSLDFTRPPNHIFREIYYLYLVRLMPLLGRLVSPDWARTFEYLAASILAFQPPHSVVERMRRVGLRRIRARPLTGGIVTILTGRRSG